MRTSAGMYLDSGIPRLRALFKAAEDARLEGVWVPDSHLLWRECYAGLGALSSSAWTLRVGLITNLSTRHYTVTASGIATLAELYGGRFRACLGAGDTAVSTSGVEQIRAQDLPETWHRLRGLLTPGGGTDDGGLRLHHLDQERPRTPLYMLCTDPASLELAGWIADGAVMMFGARADVLAQGVEIARNAAADHGRRPSELDVVAWVPCGVSDDGAAGAVDAVKHNVARVLIRQMPKPLTGLEELVRRLRELYEPSRHADVESPAGKYLPDEVAAAFALAGTGGEVRSRIEALADAGVDEVAVAVQEGPRTLSKADAIAALAPSVGVVADGGAET